MGAKKFTDLKVWQSAHQVALRVYQWTTEFPVRERYGLASQMRRAAVSTAANIAEGFGRRTAKDRAYFYVLSRGSSEELKYYMILARDLRYPDADPELESTLDGMSAMLYRLIEAVSGEDLEWGGRP